MSWTLDANGNRTLLTWPGYSVAYVYDTRDRLSDVYRTSTSGSQLQHTTYDSRSRPVSVSYGGATPVASTPMPGPKAARPARSPTAGAAAA